MMNYSQTKVETKCGFIDLLWDDILFGRILPYLSIKDLFVLRGLSRKYRLLIDTYFKQMKSIRLFFSKFSPEAFKVLEKNCLNLKEVILVNIPWLTDKMIIPVFDNNKSLRRIVLNQCNKLTTLCLQPVIVDCQDLASLCLADCRWLTVGCFQSLTLHKRTLVEVDFSGCTLVDDVDSMNNFIRLSPGLRCLNLSKLYSVDDTTLSLCARTLKQLEFLNISQCSRVTGYGLSLVMEACRNLKALIYVGCPLVAPYSLRTRPRPNLFLSPALLDPSADVRMNLPRLNV